MKKFLLSLIVLAVLGGGAYVLLWKEDKTFEVIRPVIGPAVQAVYATGTAEPSVMIPIAPRSPARLIGLQADEGQKVVKGQVLAQLEDDDLQRQLDELEVRAQFAGKDYSRKAELVKRGAVSKEAADQSKADLDAARAAVGRVQAELGYLKLLAPEDGIVLRRDGEVGELIAANDPVFWLSCCAPMRVSAEVDEEDVTLVQPGQKVIVRADAFPGKIMEGTVTSITPKGDPVARSYRVRVGLKGETPLMIGMTAETNIIIGERKDALLIPASAVKNESVWVLHEGKLEHRKIETGAKIPEAIEIREGLSTDDLVVINPAPGMVEGKAVKARVTDWKAP